MRLRNIEDKINKLLVYFIAYFILAILLLIQTEFFENTDLVWSLILLCGFHGLMLAHGVHHFRLRHLKLHLPFTKTEAIVQILENAFMMFSSIALTIYFKQKAENVSTLNIWIILSPAALSTILNCFLMRYEETPCNATFFLITKVLVVLRLLMGLSIMLKVDE